MFATSQGDGRDRARVGAVGRPQHRGRPGKGVTHAGHDVRRVEHHRGDDLGVNPARPTDDFRAELLLAAATVVGFSVGIGVAAVQLLPDWSAFSDAFPGAHGAGVTGLSWSVVLIEIAGALAMGIAGHNALVAAHVPEYRPVAANARLARRRAGKDCAARRNAVTDRGNPPHSPGTNDMFGNQHLSAPFDDIEQRAMLAIALRPSAFPGDRAQLLEVAADEFAQESVIDVLHALPARVQFANVDAVWEALHRIREGRPSTAAPAPPPATAPAPEPSLVDVALALPRIGVEIAVGLAIDVIQRVRRLRD